MIDEKKLYAEWLDDGMNAEMGFYQFAFEKATQALQQQENTLNKYARELAKVPDLYVKIEQLARDKEILNEEVVQLRRRIEELEAALKARAVK